MRLRKLLAGTAVAGLASVSPTLALTAHASTSPTVTTAQTTVMPHTILPATVVSTVRPRTIINEYVHWVGDCHILIWLPDHFHAKIENLSPEYSCWQIKTKTIGYKGEQSGTASAWDPIPYTIKTAGAPNSNGICYALFQGMDDAGRKMAWVIVWNGGAPYEFRTNPW